jgi:hypothetical protein
MQVKSKDLNPNVDWNGWVCELPFEFPVMTHGGNDIGIIRNEDKNTTTVTYWVFRNFFTVLTFNTFEFTQTIQQKLKV